MTAVQLDPLDYYSRHHCALFPLPRGAKEDPGWRDGTGIIKHFSREWSRDPAQWAAWRQAHPGCNFGLVAAPSKLIIADIDVAEVGEATAWAYWCQWWQSRNLPVPMPQARSARGGWHVLFAVPDSVDMSRLRQIPLIGAVKDLSKKPIVDLRIGNGYVVAAGSYFDGAAEGKASGHYQLLTEDPPHPAPDALIGACGRATATTVAVAAGKADPADTRRVLEWMTDHGSFESYERWYQIGMILRGEFGDDPGFSLWQITNDGTVSAEQEATKWQSYSATVTSDDLKINTLRKWAKQDGCPYLIGVSAKAMFDRIPVGTSASADSIAPRSPTLPAPAVAATVAQIASDAGAALPTNGLIGNTQRIIASHGEPYLTRFFETIHDVPFTPRGLNHPTLPANMEEVFPSIFEQMRTAIRRVVVMAETPRTFKQQRVLRVLGVLRHMHAPTCQALVDYIHGLGAALSDEKVEVAAKDFEREINGVLNNGRVAFYPDAKGRPDPAISDNVGIFLTVSNHRTQFDIFGRKVEIASAEQPFAHFDQDELDRLWMMAKSVDYNYHAAKDVFSTGIKVAARKNPYDSLDDEVQRLADAWDGLPRLDKWLSFTCNVADDAYHQAVGRNLIGGMVCRAREPGCKHDEVVIFISPEQGTGKSTLANILARRDEWFLGKFKFGQSDQSSLPLLAGKWIVELGELAGLNKTDFEDVKSFISERNDVYVAKYETLPTVNPRRCIFIGTSNLRQPLGDPSGNRRFLPVHVKGSINLNWLRSNVDQVIGEAARRHAAGERFEIPEELWNATGEAQESARSKTAVEEFIGEWFDRDGAFYILAGDIGRALKMAGISPQSRYGVFMERLGWEFAQVGRERTRIWRKRLNDTPLVALEPVQTSVNGRVEMRQRAASMEEVAMKFLASPTPPMPPTPTR